MLEHSKLDTHLHSKYTLDKQECIIGSMLPYVFEWMLQWLPCVCMCEREGDRHREKERERERRIFPGEWSRCLARAEAWEPMVSPYWYDEMIFRWNSGQTQRLMRNWYAVCNCDIDVLWKGQRVKYRVSTLGVKTVFVFTRLLTNIRDIRGVHIEITCVCEREIWWKSVKARASQTERWLKE